MKKIKLEVTTYRARIYCDPPCGEELIAKDGRSGMVTYWRHICNNGHIVELEGEKYPRLEYDEAKP